MRTLKEINADYENVLHSNLSSMVNGIITRLIMNGTKQA